MRKMYSIFNETRHTFNMIRFKNLEIGGCTSFWPRVNKYMFLSSVTLVLAQKNRR